jgi:transglutaminase-like putative cysteine protease
MPIHFIHHQTHYHYSNWVSDSSNQLKIFPKNDQHQRVVSYNLSISGQPKVFTFKDFFDNEVGFFTHTTPHRELLIDSVCQVEMLESHVVPRWSPHDVWRELTQFKGQQTLLDFLYVEPINNRDAIKRVVSFEQNAHPLDELIRLSEFIYHHFEYKKGVTTVETGLDEIWELRAGVCQDFAHLLLYMMRLVGLPGRYVSGYICPGNSEWRGEGATHAWVEAWLPDMGWVGIDPTNKCLAGERHVRLAVGRNFVDCTPVKGTYKGAADHLLAVKVQFSTTSFTTQQLKPVEINAELKTQYKSRVEESYIAYRQRQQQQQ